ncbi:GntR family transcriptional regulator [Hippea maritima]|uniref:Transcriptional regulator, GntR family n=1 Tax=Hippea maritima (strain ATCC 700847 / DSM 10411 / MH2) TaxID=760142 RepID=F2LWD6_HIPMA|nr:GntR family transcriptional regulator [Hippea maritima]AEA34070.1 transcriptional regulator, GntR family [Hippea maritima DSM 10411]
MDINTKSLREQVYDYLKEQIKSKALKRGDFLDLNALSKSLGISKTPLRDALLKLESDGFVEIKPRKGIKVKTLTLNEIRKCYQIIGTLEFGIVVDYANLLTLEDINTMKELNSRMKIALDKKDFNEYYKINVNFHNIYLNLSDNEEMLRTISIMRQRLYDFPPKSEYLPKWEYKSLKEHEILIELLRQKDFVTAGLFLKNVHWSFEVQKKYIVQYYKEQLS